MRKKIVTAIQYSPIIVSLLLHLLLLFSFSVVFYFSPTLEPQPSMEVPAYLYQESPTVKQTLTQVQKKETHDSLSPDGIAPPKQEKNSRASEEAKPLAHEKAISPVPTEPIHLLGDKDLPPKPLVKLIGKGLTAHLIYPKIAADLNLKGMAKIGFVLHPDGRVTEAHVVKSSGIEILDKAALQAVQGMSPLKGVNEYLSAAKFMMVGIIFTGDSRGKPLII